MDLITLSDKDVLDYILKDGKLIPSRCVEYVLKKHGFYEYIIHRYSNNTLNSNNKEYLRECLYRLVNSIEEPPKCRCGNTIVFKNNNYPKYCSRKCSNQDPEVLNKISKSCSVSLKSVYNLRGDEIKEKRRKTLSNNFGVDLNTSSPFGVKEIQDIASKHIEEIYGVKNTFQLQSVRNKRIENQRNSSIKLQKDRGIDIEYLENGNYLVKKCCPIHGDLEFTQTEFNNRFRISRYKISNPCYICNPFGTHTSGMQMSLLEFIKSIYSGPIIENDRIVLDGLEIDIYLPELKLGFEFNGDYWHMNPLFYRYDDINSSSNIKALNKWKNDRHKILIAQEKGVKIYHIWEYFFTNFKDLQLDFIKNLICENMDYIHPLLKLKNTLDEINGEYEIIDDMIFEYSSLRVVYLDGFYFNKISIDNKYISSLVSNEKRTIFVYDYEIFDNRKFDVIKSDIKYALNLVENRIYARKCDIRVITNNDSRKFLESNSLFGYRNASIVLGLYYNDELVMVYSFGNNYYGRNSDTEVIRVCTKKNTQVIGGSSKCLKYYIDNFSKSGERIVFYVDAIHHSGNSMKDFKFIRHEYGLMNYWIDFDKLGDAFNRLPSKNKEIKKLIEEHHIVEIPTNGVDVYEKIIE